MKLHFSFCELFGMCAVLEGNVAAINEAFLKEKDGEDEGNIPIPSY